MNSTEASALVRLILATVVVVFAFAFDFPIFWVCEDESKPNRTVQTQAPQVIIESYLLVFCMFRMLHFENFI